MNAMLSLAGRLLWPSIPMKILWLLLIGACLLSLLSAEPKLVLLPLSCLSLLVFCIPLQFMQLRHKQSWLLLPYFKPHARILLLLVTLLVGMLGGSIMYLASQPFWLGLHLSILAFATLVLPCLVFGNLKPLIISCALFILLLQSPVTLPQQPNLVFFMLLTTANLALLSWFNLNWLKTAQARQTTFKPSCNPFASWLLQFTRKPATLAGTLLLGQGDSWQARFLRSLAYCWYLPAFMLLGSLFLGFSGMPEETFLRAMFIIFPGFLLTSQLTNVLRRVRRAWLQLAVTRQQLFTMLEQLALKELMTAAIVIAPLIYGLLPAKTAVALVLFWPALMLFSLYLGWRLINVSMFWSGTAMASLTLLAVALLTLCWQQPGYLILAAAFLASTALSLRRQLKGLCQRQDWAKLKLLKAAQLNTGL